MIEDVIHFLQNDKYYSLRIAHIEPLPRRRAFHCEAGGLPEILDRYLKAKGIKPYLHQCRALELLRQGKNIIITTPTASGKTLAYNLPIIEGLIREPRSTALYLYPTKALSNDQLKTLREIDQFGHLGLLPGIYDGDISSAAKARIRNVSRIVLSNPYELHQILPWNHQWVRFLSNLRYVVIDEAHHYRGVFGSNVAYLFRRFRRLLSRYGASPQFVISSATLANPQEFAHNLTGLDYELVDEDGSPRGRKFFVFYNPFFDKDKILEASAHEETARLMARFVYHGLKTLAFNVSRRMAELVARRTRSLLKKFPQLAEKITAYRSGYLPSERRQIENDFKQGRILGVAATNALELGIDIGDLDSVIISGYPGTVISTWQQAGRAGRRQNDSIAVLVAFHDKLDQYFMRYPQKFFDRPHEHAIVDLRNPYISTGHILCAAAEMPLSQKDEEFFPPEVLSNALETLRQEGLVRQTTRGWIYTGRSTPTQIVGLTNISSNQYKVVVEGRVLETLDEGQAFREAHKGAVLLHQGETYIVQDFDLDRRIITATKQDVDYYTQPLKTSDVRIIDTLHRRRIGQVELFFGELEVTNKYEAYKIKKGDQVLGYGELDLPPIVFRTNGLWFTLPVDLKDKIWERHTTRQASIPMLKNMPVFYDASNEIFAGGLHGVEHAFIGTMPFHVMADRWDIGGLSTINHPDTGEPSIFVYDGYEGGIGLAEKAFYLFEQIIQMTHELVAGCECEDGCPACIMSPKCGNDNRPLDKQASVMILEYIRGQIG